MPRLPRSRRGRSAGSGTGDRPDAAAGDAAEQPTSRLGAVRHRAGGTEGAAPSEGPPAPPDAPVVPQGGVPTPSGHATPTDGLGGEEPDRPRRFRERRRLRRRLRELRRMRELAFRDLGGLVFDLHRFGRDRPELVEQKLATLGAMDAELRALERALDEQRPITELREPGIAACPRCGTLHGSDARFCPGCGVPLGGAPAGPLMPDDPPAQAGGA